MRLNPSNLPVFSDAQSHILNTIIETPIGSRNKYKYDGETGLFKIDKVLPSGMFFPFNFGFVPSTIADDGDPLDVLLLMDEPAFTGCLVPARPIGIIEAEQTENGKTVRNDRIVACSRASRIYSAVGSLEGADQNMLAEIERFFASYNRFFAKEFKPLRRAGPAMAVDAVRRAAAKYQAAGVTV